MRTLHLALLWVCLVIDWGSLHADPANDYIEAEMVRRQIPGLAMQVLREGNPLRTAVYGWANLELRVPVTTNTIFEIGSLTKQFTAAGILVLQQDGKLSVDDKLRDYLPEAPTNWNRITLRHLLTHTSGLKSYTGLEGFELRRHLTKAQFIAAIAAQPVEFAPGEAWKYCNTGYNLLGFVIEKASGKGYWEFMSERVFRPLGMTATTNRSPFLVLPDRASGYEQTNHVLINRDPDLTDVFSAGALVSNVADLAKWSRALDGEQLLNQSTKDLMWTPARLNNGTGVKYGFGWGIDVFSGRRNIGHGGSTSGFSASIQRFPDDKLVVIILTNTDEQVAPALARKIASFYLR